MSHCSLRAFLHAEGAIITGSRQLVRIVTRGRMSRRRDRMRLATVLTMASGAPLDVTTGSDDNGDLIVNDRPSGVSRNTGVGPGLTQVDLRLTTIQRAPRPP